jgi:uncharacterized membrane protein HdeD (DUF308 family)
MIDVDSSRSRAVDQPLRSWGGLAVQGIAALVFGVLTLLWPGITLTVLVLFWGAYALVDGVTRLYDAVTGKVTTAGQRALVAISGLAGVAAGIITFVWPGITALVLLYVIAAWAVVTGIVEIADAFRRRPEFEHRWLLGLAGLLSIALGIVLVVAPVAGALAITWAIGWWACLSAGLLLAAAWGRRSPNGHVRSPGWSDRAAA